MVLIVMGVGLTKLDSCSRPATKCAVCALAAVALSLHATVPFCNDGLFPWLITVNIFMFIMHEGLAGCIGAAAQ